MPKPRGRSHTTLTGTARTVIAALRSVAGIKMIAPGEIRPRRASTRHLTIITTAAGCELLISGQGVQKVAVHTTSPAVVATITTTLRTHKTLKEFAVSHRSRLPGT